MAAINTRTSPKKESTIVDAGHSFTEENYLKTILKLSEQSEDAVSTNAIAFRLGTKAATVTDMIRKLSQKKLIHYKKYQGVRLTARGTKVAWAIVRRHRLWEVFLTEKLHFKWDEIHNIAEELEHINSEELVKRLDKFLGFPKFDPHGDPIPDSKGRLSRISRTTIKEMQIKQTAIMTGVIDHTSPFLRHLEMLKLTPGKEIKLLRMLDFDGSCIISINRGEETYISSLVASNILVSIRNEKV